MSAEDDKDFLELAHEMISENGRTVIVGKLSDARPDTARPWKGPATTPTLELSYSVKGVFLPDMTLGLIGGSGFGRMDMIEELVKQSEQVALVAHPYGVTLREFTSCNVLDDVSGRYRIHARKVLMPGDSPIFYALGLIR